jgi:tryptophanase
VDYVGWVAGEVARVRDRLPAMRVVQAPRSLRHFSAAMRPVGPFPDFDGDGAA